MLINLCHGKINPIEKINEKIHLLTPPPLPFVQFSKFQIYLYAPEMHMI